MSTPDVVSKLSVKEQKQTISAKKKTSKSLRNILTSGRNSVWPILEGQERDSLYMELEKMTQNTTKTIIKDSLPRKNRCEKIKFGSAVEIRKSLAFGIKETTQCLKSDKCFALLLDADTPKMMLQHMVYLANVKNIPTICITGLKDFMKFKFGFKSTTICLRSKLNNILELITKVNAKENNSYGRKALFNSMMSNSNEDLHMINDTKGSIPEIEKNIVVTYLVRSNNKERTFIPPSSKCEILSKLIENNPSSDYMSVTTDYMNKSKAQKSEFKNKEHKKKGKIFEPLVVHKIQSNSKRRKHK